MMSKSVLVAGLGMVVAVVWYLQSVQGQDAKQAVAALPSSGTGLKANGALADGGAVVLQTRASAASAASAGSAGSADAAAPASLGAVTPTSTANATLATGASKYALGSASASALPDNRPEWLRNPPDLGLTRALAGDQAVSLDGRARTVLGTKDSATPSPNSSPNSTTTVPPQAVLLVRDDASGQVDYFQSGLQFRLKPGLDFDAFIREHPAQQRQFVSADYAMVLVDAASIASEFKALQNDARVTMVTFLKPRPASALR